MIMRKTILVLLFLSSVCALAYSQNFTVSNLSPEGSNSASGYFDVRTRVKNNTNNNLSLEWTRTSINIPSGWDVAVCDEQCYTPGTATHSLQLLPRQERDLRIVFYPKGNAGNGSVDLVLSESNSDNSSTTIHFAGTANSSSSTSGFVKKPTSIKIYPNPAVEYIQLDNTDGVSRIEIYNMVGTKVSTYNVNSPDDRFSVSELPRGLYLVRIYGRKGEILFTQRVSKYNP
jgi:hypothetical protein